MILRKKKTQFRLGVTRNYFQTTRIIFCINEKKYGNDETNTIESK